MSENEQINVNLNAYESSGSTNNMLMKNVEVSPESIELNVLSASSATTSSVTWKINTSDNLLLSRRMIVEIPITFHVSAPNADTLRNFYVSPRADCLHRIISSAQVNVNGSSIVSNPADFCEVVQFYSRESQHFHNQGILSQTPAVPDLAFSNGLSFTGTATSYPDTLLDLRTYHLREENFDRGYQSRLASTPYFKLGRTSVDGNNADQVCAVTFFVRAAIKNPVFSSVASEVLCNVNTLEITLQFDSARFKDKLFFGTIPASHNGNAPQVIAYANILGSVGVAGTTQAGDIVINPPDRNDFRLSYYAINPSNPDTIPETLLLPSQEIFRNQQSMGVQAGAFTVTHQEISLSQIPSMIFISCTPQYGENSKTYNTSDYHAPIRNLNIQINGRTYPYTMYTPRDLYAMSCENGLKQTFQAFNTWTTLASGHGVSTADTTGTLRSTVAKKLGVGSPICLMLSKNIGGRLKVNLTESCRIQVRYDATNTSGVATFDFVSNVHYVMNNTLVIQKGSPLKQLNGISPEEYASAVSQGFVQSIGANKDDEEDVLLGGSFSSTFRDGARGFIKFLNTANNLLQSASQIYPDRIPNQLSYEANRATQMANAVQNSGMLGSGMLGGSRLDMMRANGLLR